MERHRWQQKRIVLQDIRNLVEHEGNNTPVEIDKIQIDDSDSFHLCIINADYAIRWETFEGEPCGGYENWFFFASFDKATDVFEEIKRQVGTLDNYNGNTPNDTKV